MKRGTPRHPKTYALAEALKIPLPHAVGILEMLWQHAAQFTPRGDIGSLPDSAVAQAVGWNKKAPLLTAGLVSSGWLENSSEYRLIIHDWPEHCEQAVVKWLEYNGKDFLPIYGQSLENRKRLASESLPSRVGKGRGEGLGEGKNRKKEKSEVYSGQNADFEEFWATYWRKAAVGAARQSFRKNVTSHDLYEKVMQAIRVQIVPILCREMESRPHASTWLNQHRWEDDPAAYAASANGSRRESLTEQMIREAKG